MMTAQEEFLELVTTNSKLLSDDSIKTLTAILRLCLYKDCREHALSETRQALADKSHIEEVELDEWDKQAIADYENNPNPEFTTIEEIAQEFGINL